MKTKADKIERSSEGRPKGGYTARQTTTQRQMGSVSNEITSDFQPSLALLLKPQWPLSIGLRTDLTTIPPGQSS